MTMLYFIVPVVVRTVMKPRRQKSWVRLAYKMVNVFAVGIPAIGATVAWLQLSWLVVLYMSPVARVDICLGPDSVCDIAGAAMLALRVTLPRAIVPWGCCVSAMSIDQGALM